ncbi:MAG: hypothetical protein KDB03_04920 [Planctomycetales bacterium]|nr:hypothetical protein [Planctomycetales bacterium]
MNPRKIRRRSARLQDRDYDILEFVSRYRMVTREILHRIFFDDSELNAVTKVTSRLTEAAFLSRHPFVNTASYFTLGIAGCKLFGLPARCAKELGAQALVTQFGIVDYCTAPGATRARLTVGELHAHHNSLLQKNLDPANYVNDATGEVSKLQFVRVDGGGPADHVVRKIKLDMALRETNTICKELNQLSRFEIACVTYSESKLDQIKKRLDKEQLWCPVQLFNSLGLLPLLDF